MRPTQIQQRLQDAQLAFVQQAVLKELQQNNETVSQETIEAALQERIAEIMQKMNGCWPIVVSFKVDGKLWLDDTDPAGMMFFMLNHLMMGVGFNASFINDPERLKDKIKENVAKYLADEKKLKKLLKEKLNDIIKKLGEDEDQSLSENLTKMLEWLSTNLVKLTKFESRLFKLKNDLKEFEAFLQENLPSLLKNGTESLEQDITKFFHQYIQDKIFKNLKPENSILSDLGEFFTNELSKQAMVGFYKEIFTDILCYGGPWNVAYDPKKGKFVSEHTVESGSSPARLKRSLEIREINFDPENGNLILTAVFTSIDPATKEPKTKIVEVVWAKSAASSVQNISEELFGAWELVNGEDNNNQNNEGFVYFTPNGYFSFNHNHPDVKNLDPEKDDDIKKLINSILFINGEYKGDEEKKEQKIMCKVITSSNLELRNTNNREFEMQVTKMEDGQLQLSFDTPGANPKHYSWKLQKIDPQQVAYRQHTAKVAEAEQAARLKSKSQVSPSTSPSSSRTKLPGLSDVSVNLLINNNNFGGFAASSRDVAERLGADQSTSPKHGGCFQSTEIDNSISTPRA